MECEAVTWVVSDVSKDRADFMFKSQAVQEEELLVSEYDGTMTVRNVCNFTTGYGALCRKTRIFSNTAVRTSNVHTYLSDCGLALYVSRVGLTGTGHRTCQRDV